MLSKITISNFIIIDKLEIDFNDGFATITGETGTGKSILIDAIEFCFGNGNSKNLKKYHDKITSIELQFYLEETSELKKILGFDIDHNFTLNRKVDINDKSQFLIGNKQISKKIIKDLKKLLITIVSQFETILDKKEYIKVLDRFMIVTNPAMAERLNHIANLYSELRDIQQKIVETEEKIALFNKEKEYNLEIIKDLETADVKDNEETELLEKRSLIQKANSVQNLVNAALDLIDSIPITQKLNQILKQLQRADNQAITSISERIENVILELSDIFSELQDIRGKTFSSQADIEQVDDRISTLRTLGRKYNISTGLLFDFLNSAKNSVQKANLLNENLKILEDKKNKLDNEFQSLALELSYNRKIAAEKLSTMVCSQLKKLNMTEATFRIDVSYKDEVQNQYGKDEIELLANFNSSVDLMPIKDIASGGEAARLNFAIKSILANFESPKTIIFDEIDIGIGGAAAYLMGSAMRNLGQKLQVISITHSPQVAAKSNYHFVVKKKITADNVNISTNLLNFDERINEIARMISGTSINEEAILAARQLLE